MYQNKCNTSTATGVITLHSGHMHELDLTVNMLRLFDPSNLLFVLSAKERHALLRLL